MRTRKLQPFAPYYVYEHYRLDTNEIFYVGLGSQDKHYFGFNRAHSRQHRNKHWNNVVSKVGFRVEICFVTGDYKEAKIREKELVVLYGKRMDREGPLVNIEDGGEHGHSHTSDTKRRISSSLSRLGPDNPNCKSRFKVGHKMANEKPIAQYSLEGILLTRYRSIAEAGRLSGISSGAIRQCIKRGKAMSGGYKWIYV